MHPTMTTAIYETQAPLFDELYDAMIDASRANQTDPPNQARYVLRSTAGQVFTHAAGSLDAFNMGDEWKIRFTFVNGEILPMP